MDPLAGLMSMDFDFPLQAAPQFSLVQILIILSEMYTGAQDPDDDLITGLRKRWWRERSRAQSGGRIGAGMEIRWEPTFEVIGVETLDYSPTTLGGVDFDDLTSIQLFYIAARVITPHNVSDEESVNAQMQLARRRDAATPRPLPSHLPTPPILSSPTSAFVSSFVAAIAGPSTSPEPISNSASSPFTSTTYSPISFTIPTSIKTPSSRPSALSISDAPVIPSIATSWLDTLRKSASELLDNLTDVSPTRSVTDGAAKRPRLDLEEEDLAVARRGKASRRDQLGSTDEFTIESGDRLAHGLNDPNRPSSSSKTFIPRQLSDQLHTLHISKYPADYTLQDLSDLLTLPGHDPPIGLASRYRRYRQFEPNANRRTKYAFVAFEKEETKNAVCQARDQYDVEGLEECRICVTPDKSGYDGWQWTAFPEDFKREWESRNSSVRPQEGSGDRLRSTSHQDTAQGDRSDNGAGNQSANHSQSQSEVPPKLMLRFPQLHMNQFPPRSPHVTVPKLLDFFARTVDPNLILSIYIGKMDAVRQVVPVYVAMKTSESANQLMNAVNGAEFPGAERPLYAREIPPHQNWRKWRWNEMSPTFVPRFQEECRAGLHD